MAVNSLSSVPHYFLLEVLLYCDVQDILTRIPLVCRRWKDESYHRDICVLLGRSIGTDCNTRKELREVVRRIKVIAFEHRFRFTRESSNFWDLSCTPKKYLSDLIQPKVVYIRCHNNPRCRYSQHRTAELDRVVNWCLTSLKDLSAVELLLEINRCWRKPIEVAPDCRFRASFRDGLFYITRQLPNGEEEQACIYFRRTYTFTQTEPPLQLDFGDGVNLTQQRCFASFIRFYIEFSHTHGDTHLYRVLESMGNKNFRVKDLWSRMPTHESYSVVK